MGFFQGVIKGAAESIETDVKRRMEESRAGVRRAADFHVRRAAAEDERYKKKLEEVDKALESYASITGGNYEEAAALLRGIGGVSQASTYFPMIQKALALGTPLSDLAQFKPPPANTPARTKQQLMDHFATLRMPQLPTVPEAGGWAKLFGVGGDSVEDVVEKDLAAYGLTTDAPERVGDPITPAAIDYSKLDPVSVLEYKAAKQKLSTEQARTAGLKADTKLNQARERKINAEIKNLGPQARAELDLANARILKTEAETDKVEYLLGQARQNDPTKHALFVRKQQAEILRAESGSGQKAHISFLLAHNKELDIVMQGQGMEGRVDANYEGAKLKREANDRVLAHYARYMKEDQASALFGKINPISAFNSILEGAFAGENLTFEPGIGDSLARVIEGDRLAINRAYNSSLASFADAYGDLGIAANRFIKAQSGQLKRAEATYVQREVNKRIEHLKEPGFPKELSPGRGETGAFSIGGSKGIINLFVDKKNMIPVKQRKAGQIYYNKNMVKLGYTMPYAIWSGNGWLMPGKVKKKVTP